MTWILALIISASTATFARAETDYETAHRLVLQQKWSQALPMLEKLHAEAPSSALIGEDLAGALLRANRREEAIRTFRRYGLKEQAGIAATAFLAQENYKQYQEGVSLLNSQRYALACEKFERTLEKEAAHRDLQLRLLQCNALNGAPADALKYADALEQEKSMSPEALLWKGYALSLSGPDRRAEAIATLQSAMKQLPSSENAVIWLADALSAAGQKAQAIAALEADLKRNSLHVGAIVQLARLKFSTATRPGDYQEVRNLLELAQSRLKRYAGPEAAHFESEEGIDLRDPEQTKRGIDLLFQRNEEKSVVPAS